MISAWDLLSDAGKDAVRQADETPLPSVEPLSPGARPTEPGWYVVQDSEERSVVQVAPNYGSHGPLRVFKVEYLAALAIEDFTFIARIYPDRIGQE